MIKIHSIQTSIPKNQMKYNDSEKIKKIINYSGFKKINLLNKDSSVFDLVMHSVKKLILKSKFDKSKIDAIIFTSHSRDIEMPSISALIHRELSLKQKIFCYDLPLSCSGFSYSLIHAHNLIKSEVAKNVLIVCGDSLSKYIDRNNINLKYIIGDSFSSIIVTKSNKDKFQYDFGCEGNKDVLNLDITKKNNKFNMNGILVMSFAMNTVYKHIKNFIKINKINLDKTYTCLHQPNFTIHDYLITKLRLDKKFNISNFNYGNTSAGSIPLAINSYFFNKKNKIIKNNILISGFGEGLMWSSCHISIQRSKFLGVDYF